MSGHGEGSNNRGNTVSLSAGSVEVVGKASAGSATFPRTVAVQNVHSSHVAYLGFSSAVTVANGWRLLPGESITFDLMEFDSLWALSNNAAEIRVLVLNAGGIDV